MGIGPRADLGLKAEAIGCHHEISKSSSQRVV